LFTACVNLLQSVDVVLVKGFASPDDVGFYSSAQQVALVPLSLMNAVSLLMFPLVAALGSHPERVRSYVAGTVKVSLVLLAFMASVGAAAAPEVQALLFPRAYGAAAGDLRLLVWGMSGYSLAITIAWILNSTQRPRVALLVVATPLVVVVAVALGLLPGFGTRGAAIAVACGGAVATVLALGAVTRLFAARPRVADLLRLVAAVAAVEVVAAGWSSPPAAGAVGRLGILARLAALAATYLVVAFGTRLVRVAELRSLRRGA
jgi:O-antigen/teichoic acid export membrane protein